MKCDQRNSGFGGSSLDYVYYQFDRVQNEISLGDYVIVALTSPDRRYFDIDDPSFSSLWNIGDRNPLLSSIDKEKINALELYYKHLHNYDIRMPEVINFLYRLQYITQRLQLKTIVFACFDGLDEIYKHMAIQLAFWLNKKGILLSIIRLLLIIYYCHLGPVTQITNDFLNPFVTGETLCNSQDGNATALPFLNSTFFS